ncbi:hypothetical protein [Thalassovita sp.]|jgi:hypothetical protein|uniref:hypothetical protein n=1 Tax=Thalassovita sp. TaxID=1979401 RepID=UPI003B59F558
MRHYLFLFSLATPALAETPMNGDEFDAYTRDKTFYFAESGQPYGAEEYLPNRRVRWSFLDGRCKDGKWYEEAGQICFVYEDRPDPQCWSFFDKPAGLIARFEGVTGGTILYETRQSEQPMMCMGPDVGV